MRPTNQDLIMHDDDHQNGAKPEDVRAALRGWAFFAVLMTGIFGVAYALIEM
jgi:hypothetical protein